MNKLAIFNNLNIKDTKDLDFYIKDLKDLNEKININLTTATKVDIEEIRKHLSINTKNLDIATKNAEQLNKDIKNLKINLETIKDSISTMNRVNALRYAAIPATVIAALASPVAFASVAGLSAITLGIGSWQATKEREKLLFQIDRLKKSTIVNTVKISKDFVSRANRISVGGSVE